MSEFGCWRRKASDFGPTNFFRENPIFCSPDLRVQRCTAIVLDAGDFGRQDAAGKWSPSSSQGPADFLLEPLGTFGAWVGVESTPTTMPASSAISNIPYYTQSKSRCFPLPTQRSLCCSRPLLPQNTSSSTNAHREDCPAIFAWPFRGPVRQGWRLCHTFARHLHDT